MVLVFGSKLSKIRTGQLTNINCPNCNSITTMSYNVFANYLHLILIPVFPVKKVEVCECDSCKKTFEHIRLIEPIKEKFKIENEKRPIRYPIWMYTGTFLILVLFSYGFYDIKKTSLNNEIYIKNPKIGDVYYLKLASNRFTTARVDGVSRTNVRLTNNDYEIDSEYDISSIDETENYTKSKDTLSILKIQEYFKKETIIEIKRK